MVPSVDLQLQAAIKALSDTVGPAIDPADKVASEQLHLVIATLGMVRERLPAQRRFIRRLLEDAAAIAGAVNASEHDDRLAEAVVVARAALADPELEAHELEIGRAHVELQSLMRISYAVFCLKKKNKNKKRKET